MNVGFSCGQVHIEEHPVIYGEKGALFMEKNVVVTDGSASSCTYQPKVNNREFQFTVWASCSVRPGRDGKNNNFRCDPSWMMKPRIVETGE